MPSRPYDYAGQAQIRERVELTRPLHFSNFYYIDESYPIIIKICL